MTRRQYRLVEEISVTNKKNKNLLAKGQVRISLVNLVSCNSVGKLLANWYNISFLARTALLIKMIPQTLINELLAGTVPLKNLFVKTVSANNEN